MDSRKENQVITADELPSRADHASYDDVRITRSKLAFDQLSIVDDNLGGDPYNSTGAHCILKAKDAARE